GGIAVANVIDKIATCTNYPNERILTLNYLIYGSKVPCEVVYEKLTEIPGHRRVLWRAKNTVGYCERKLDNFLKKLKGYGWHCSYQEIEESNYEIILPIEIDKEQSTIESIETNIVTEPLKSDTEFSESKATPWIELPDTQPTKPSSKRVIVQYGDASYYADRFQGRTTASGEIYDKNKLTAAHQSLTFGTRVRVTFLKTGQSVEVIINDRGNFYKDRIIDLSRKAAEEIGLIRDGHGKVMIEILK
ncbi:septal ring lytic transglycosylase RlpA family protein, partial [Candidatus Parabeggiatoa sp. HSG14]|uniref:septal ring lytic transglycosylase RlpA family protein n=1 Tax=Candidatus Parabeggiatoa sp. HSG14 TaxID=3055593 RepID=UPI0025A81671|nr:septal ring lytic transglycosylase RlpA family protein [Thiotrichales bacterium HSG14]